VETGAKKGTNADNMISLSPAEFFAIHNKDVITEKFQPAKNYLILACFTGKTY
jgi:hypothetical protein